MRTTLSYAPHGLEAMDCNGPRLLLAEHHRGLHQAGENLIARAHEGDCLGLVAEFRVFESQILEHMRAEEEIVLPAFTEADPAEAAVIREGHAFIRKQLERTALDIELHEVRLDALRELLAVLDAHSKREDQRMYPWAQMHLPVASRGAIGTRVLASLREIAKLWR